MARARTVHVISDALGDTACEVVLAAAGQFHEGSIAISRLPHASSIDQVTAYLKPYISQGEAMAVFYTIVNERLRTQVGDMLNAHGIPAVDVMGPAIGALSTLLGTAPLGVPGVIHATDDRYFRRIECMEYFVEHDDGRGSDDLSKADIVLIGVSRTSKTPLSMYLAFQGYHVANIPLAPGMDPPPALFSVDPARLIGLLSTPDAIAHIRDQRLGSDAARIVAASYADPGAIAREMEDARSFMKRLGCFMVRTDGKAIEESAAEIVGHLERVRAARARRT